VKHKVCVEYDGEEFHDSLEAQAHDEARRAWLRAHGWIVVVVRKEDFSAEARLTWVSTVRDALDARHH
jgi:very-short-patch-repair endonuclease